MKKETYKGIGNILLGLLLLGIATLPFIFPEKFLEDPDIWATTPPLMVIIGIIFGGGYISLGYAYLTGKYHD